MKNKEIFESYEINKKILINNNVYREEDEHSSCGVGLIASIYPAYRGSKISVAKQLSQNM